MYTEAPASVTIKTISPGGYDLLLTIRDTECKDLMPRVLAALTWLDSNGFRPTTNGHRNGNGNSAGPLCPAHQQPMKPSQHGGWYCPVKIADDDGTGKAVYCKQKVK